MDVPEFDVDKAPHRAEVWADHWISLNELNQEFTPSQNSNETPRKFLLASNKEPQIESAKVNNPSKNKSDVFVSRKKSSGGEINSSSEEIAIGFLKSSPVPTISSNEVVDQITPSINYEAHLGISYAQRKSIEKKSTKSSTVLFAGGSLGPQFANGVVDQPSGVVYSDVSNIDKLTAEGQGVGNSINGQGYMAMVNVGVRLSEKIEIHSGVNFTQTSGNHDTYFESEVKRHQTIITGVNIQNEDGSRSMETVETDVSYTNYFSDTLQSNYRLSNFEIPLVLKYNFGKNKLSYFLSSGVSTVLGASYSASFESDQIGSGNLNEVRYGFNTLNLLFGAGIQYAASSNVVIKLAPGYRYGIPLTDASSFQSNSSSLGFFTGLNYYFK